MSSRGLNPNQSHHLFKPQKGGNTNSALNAVHSQTPVIKSVVAHHRLIVRHEEGPFNLNTHRQAWMQRVVKATGLCLCWGIYFCGCSFSASPRDGKWIQRSRRWVPSWRPEPETRRTAESKESSVSPPIERTCCWSHGDAPVSTSRVDLCRWRNTQRVQTVRWPRRYPWGRMGRWRGCWKSTACRGPT